MGSMKPQDVKKTAVDALANLLLKGRMEAVALAMLFYFIPFFSFLTSVTVALVTLRKGTKEGLFVASIAMVPALIVATQQAHMIIGLAEVIVTFGVAWLFASVLYESRSWGMVLYTALGVAVLIGIIAHVGFPEHVVRSKALLKEMFMLLQKKGQLKYDAVSMQENINWFASYFLGMQIAVSTFMVLVNLAFARYMQSKVFYPGGFGKEVLYFRLTPGLALPFIGSLVGLLLDVTFAKCIVIVSAFPLVLAGLSLMHWRIRRFGKGQLLVLLPSYFLLITFPFTFIPLMAIGFADMWLDFRTFKVSDDSQ